MPEPITHGATVAGTVSAVLAFVFDVPPPVVFAAFAGSCFAVAMAESIGYCTALMMLLGGTFVGSYLTPYASHYVGDYSLKGLAAFVAFVLVHFRNDALTLIKELFKMAIRKARGLFGGVTK